MMFLSRYSTTPSKDSFINKNLSIRGTFSRRDDGNSFKYFMPYSLTKSASGTEGGYMDFLNGFGYSDSKRVEDNYEIRANYQNKFGKFDLNAFVGGIISGVLNKNLVKLFFVSQLFITAVGFILL